MVVHRGVGNVPKPIDLIDDPASGPPSEAKSVSDVLTRALKSLGAKISELDREISRRAKADGLAKRLMPIPGVGSIVAIAMVALAPAPETFRRGRDFAAWVGLTPLQHSSGGKERLGRTSKMGERTLRRLLIIGASSAAKAASAKGSAADPWLTRMLARKPRMLVVVALGQQDREDRLSADGARRILQSSGLSGMTAAAV